MNNIIKDKISELEKLFAENKTAEAQALIEKIILEKGASEDRGEDLVNIASVYLDIMNSIDSQYESALKTAIAGLKDLNKRESKKNDEESLRKVRGNLG